MNPDELYRLTHEKHYCSVVFDANTVIKAAVRISQRPAVAVSGGKDSVAMAHIVAKHCKPLLIWNDSGMELPESKDVVEKLADRLGCRLVVSYGNAVAEWKKLNAGGRVSVDNRSIIYPTVELLDRELIDLEFVGLREGESKTRRMLIRKYGPIHNSKRWGRFLAWPMRRWTAEDSLAYIDEHNLPLHPAYLRVKFAAREKIRVSWLYDDQWAADDSAELCRRYYPRIYANLKREGIIP